MSMLVGIPTCGRPEYLSCLLSSLIYQDELKFDVLIADSDPRTPAEHDPMVQRFANTLRGTGRKVEFVEVPVVGKSEASAVNFLLLTAVDRGYDYFYKVDDDHIVPPQTLKKLKERHIEISSEKDCPILLSGLTPWMYAAWKGATSPEDPPRSAQYLDNGLLTKIEKGLDGEIKIEPNHFFRYKMSCLKETQLASAANFFMVPDARLLWSDIGPSSLYADAIWFLQLRKYLGYRMWFDLSLEVWHAAAPSGGVRDRTGDFGKSEDWDLIRLPLLQEFLED